MSQNHIVDTEAIPLSINKAGEKPFGLVGPYRFSEDYYDFFFVAKGAAIRTATDKGGDTWACIGNRLFLLDALAADRLRAPYWDDIRSDKAGAIEFEPASECYVFTFKLNSRDPAPVLFAIPERFFTPDMPPTGSCP